MMFFAAKQMEVLADMIGREREVNELLQLYNGKKAELVAIYGRRRVGKTYLVDETFRGKITFRHAGLSPVEENKKGFLKAQLEHFYYSLLLQGMKKSHRPESWLEAFYMLETFLEERNDGDRQVVFLDELPWLDSPRSGFMTAFEGFWNTWGCHRSNLMVIVCGSASSWMKDALINNHGGLYNRVTYIIKLSPFTLRECEAFFAETNVRLSQYDIVQSYMALGGIPYYLGYFESGLSLAQNMDKLFFSKQAKLREEYDRLFSSLFVNPEVMKAIIEALSLKNMGLTRQELLQKTGIANSGEFSNQLKALISGSFIMKYCSFGSSKREEYYKLTDPFCLFFLRFVGEKAKRRTTDWTNISDTGSAAAWRGYAFENVCFNHIRQIKAALGISGVSTNETLWSKKGSEEVSGTQIDLIIERKDNIVNMCEVKFCNDEFAVNRDYHFTLVRRKNLLLEKVPKRAAIHNTLITTYGLKQNEYYSDFVQTITLDDLFKE